MNFNFTHKQTTMTLKNLEPTSQADTFSFSSKKHCLEGSNGSTQKAKKRNFAYRSIQYLLGNLKLRSSRRQTDTSQLTSHTESAISTDMAASNVLFGKKSVSNAISVGQSSYDTHPAFVHQNSVGSTQESLDSDNSFDQAHEQDHMYEVIESMLSADVIGEVMNSNQRLLVESIFNGLLGDQKILFQIPCIVSQDKSSFFVFVNQMDAVKFNKTTLFNLVNTAENASSQCKRLVFVVHKSQPNCSQMAKMFDIIDASEISGKDLCRAECQDKDLYAFFELLI